MSRTLHYSSVLVSFFLALSFTVAFSSKCDYAGRKSLHFTVYDQEIFNETAYEIVKGVDTGAAPSKYSMAFGSLLAYHDPLTSEANRSSEVVGSMEGISVISPVNGLQSINIITMTLSLKEHKGSISLVGVAPNGAPGNLTVVGGTGDFTFVQGYVTSSPIYFTPPIFTYKFEFHVYWPPYATY